ncbi:hypothetical protein [Amycolatopsis sulphurea]|uniref:hypothetical protein n=1 Tax=Amycolatopsis sulphurea TaxID=76022 RepID=UPI001FEAFA22|nr:hypothetical protein [Amycolatopsis sulphurea]
MFTIGLSAADREFLIKLTTSGAHPARMIMRARVLLELDENAGSVADRAVIADRVGISVNTVLAIAKRFDETNGDALATIGRKQREHPPVASVITGEVEARLIRQPQCGMFGALSLVVAVAGAGLVASSPQRPVIGVGFGVGGVGESGPESSEFIAG